MHSPLPAFTIVYQPAQTGPARLLDRCPDANAATVAAHAHCDRLRKQGREGTVLLVRTDAAQTVVLRLPLITRPTRVVAPTLRAASAAPAARWHAGWSTRLP